MTKSKTANAIIIKFKIQTDLIKKSLAVICQAIVNIESSCTIKVYVTYFIYASFGLG